MVEEQVLRDGSVVTLRRAEPADAGALHALYDELERDDVRLRFFSPTADTDRVLLRLLAPSNVNVVAMAGARLVGHGMYAPLAADRAEVAFTVAHDAQGHGVGTLLLRRLAAMACADGIATFVADVLPDNHRMIDMFRQSGFQPALRSDAGTIEVELPTALTPEALERYLARERSAAVAGVRHLLRPDGIVIVGASRRRGTVAGELVHNVLAAGYAGPLHLVNHHADEVQGRAAFRSLDEVPGPIELAVVAVPAAAVVGVARACAARGVRGLVVLAAGFAEAGPDGEARQAELLGVCRSNGMRLVGPNCMGVRNNDPAVALDATFAPRPPRHGRLGLLTQSGGLGLAAMEEAERRHIGLSAFLSVGNKADVSGNDLLEWWEQDDDTDAVLLYLESFGNPRRFARIARRVARTTPIVAVKAGRSKAGARAAASHTGRLLAASDATVDALFHHAGVIRVDTLDELLDTGALLAGTPAPNGPRVGIVGNAGGLGILALDACEAGGLTAPELSSGLRDAIDDRATGGGDRQPCRPAGPRHRCALRRGGPPAGRKRRDRCAARDPCPADGEDGGGRAGSCSAVSRPIRPAASRSCRSSSEIPPRQAARRRSPHPSPPRGRWRARGSTAAGGTRQRNPFPLRPGYATRRPRLSSRAHSGPVTGGSGRTRSRPCCRATGSRPSRSTSRRRRLRPVAPLRASGCPSR